MSLAVVVGLGEVGIPILDMLCKAYGCENIRGYDIKLSFTFEGPFKFMHICFPQNPDFVKQIGGYIKKFEPEYIIVHSTLSPGMTTWLSAEYSIGPPECRLPAIAYSPVRGNIKNGMIWSLERYTKYVAAFGLKEEEKVVIIEHLEGAGFKTKYLEDPEALECAKIWDLAWYGLNIAFYQEMERALSPAAVRAVREYISSTPVESEGKVPRILLYGGFIGGHCVIPAIEKILAQHDIQMLRSVLDSNLKRAVELTYEKPDHHPK
jgi:hypothetical protein